MVARIGAELGAKTREVLELLCELRSACPEGHVEELENLERLLGEVERIAEMTSIGSPDGDF